MRKVSITVLLLTAVVLFQFCSSSKKTAAVAVKEVTYENSIGPIIQTSCAPCHIEGKGNKKPLSNYTAAKDNVDEMITRIQKNPDDHEFMPKMHSKLSDSTITAFIDWKKTGLKEK